MTASYAIDIQNDRAYAIDEGRLCKAIEMTLTMHHQPVATGVTVVFEDDATITALNEIHRGKAMPTDVLSFPSDIPTALMADEPYLGDIIIAYPYTQVQAERHQHAMADTLCLLVVHGCLHLLGYDHDTPDNKAKMWEMQTCILTQLGVDVSIVPSLEDA